MMISKEMNEKLNAQIMAEFSAAHTYLAESCALDDMGFKILAARFLQQANEERDHAMKILHYVQEVGGSVKLGALAHPQADYESVEKVVECALNNEIDITKSINGIVALSEKENDYATRSFLQWFIDEQVEEVASMRDLLQLVRLSKGNILQVEARVRHEMIEEESQGQKD